MNNRLASDKATFIMIKSDACHRGHVLHILDKFSKEGILLAAMWMTSLTDDQINEFYKDHVDKPYFEGLKHSVSGEVVVCIMGNQQFEFDMIKHVRELIGATNSSEADPESIRGIFGGHRFYRNTPIADNAIHASDSYSSFLREASMFFPNVVRRLIDNKWPDSPEGESAQQ
jgi:nucleoside-diphosphate kinase